MLAWAQIGNTKPPCRGSPGSDSSVRRSFHGSNNINVDGDANVAALQTGSSTSATYSGIKSQMIQKEKPYRVGGD